MEPYTLRDRINYLISWGVSSEARLFEEEKTLGLIKKLKRKEKKYGYKFMLCSICNKCVLVNGYNTHLLLENCVNIRDSKIWLNGIGDSKSDVELELAEAKEIRLKDETKVCFACNRDEELSSPESFLAHLNGNRHKLYAEIEQDELKCLKPKVENWLETGIFHKV